MKGLTRAEKAAIELLGRRRKTHAKVGIGRPISKRIFNQLKHKGLVMWISLEKKTCMLTVWGEKVWTKMHPHSKYRVR